MDDYWQSIRDGLITPKERPKKTKKKKKKKKNTKQPKQPKQKIPKVCNLALEWPYCYWCGKILTAENATVDREDDIAILSCTRYSVGRCLGFKLCQEPDRLAGFKTQQEWARSTL